MSEAAGKRIALYIGWNRPPVPEDSGEICLERFMQSESRLAGVILHKDDALTEKVRKKGIPVLFLPEQLCAPRRQIQTALADPAFAGRWTAWLESFRALDADLGFMFYASWIPAQLFRIPPEGFLNFHPGPLPRLRGFEPETFAILEGLSHTWGTFHVVEEEYDAGAIVWRTELIALTPQDTPIALLSRLTRAGLDALPGFLQTVARGKLVRIAQDASKASNADRRNAMRESYIDWENDSHDQIDRRARAFNGQKIPIRLKARLESRTWRIHNVETLSGVFSGKPGEVLGLYPEGTVFRGQPIIRTREGVAVVRLGHCCEQQASSCLKTGRCAHCSEEPICPMYPLRRELRLELVEKAISAGRGVGKGAQVAQRAQSKSAEAIKGKL
jgi:methionyl-tRNA formyltransferase